MFRVGRPPTPGKLRPAELVGNYALYDDGWPRRLTVKLDANGQLQAAFHSYRAGEQSDFAASIQLGGTAPHQVTLVVDDFNELPQQVFRGWFFTRTGNGFAGTTEWKGNPFGFYARRSRPLALHAARDRPVTMADLAGSYTMVCDGEPSSVQFDTVGTAGLEGELTEPGGDGPLAVTGEVHMADSPRLTLVIHGVAGAHAPVTFDGFLFGRPRNAIAGELLWDGLRLGCYLTRYG